MLTNSEMKGKKPNLADRKPPDLDLDHHLILNDLRAQNYDPLAIRRYKLRR